MFQVLGDSLQFVWYKVQEAYTFPCKLLHEGNLACMQTQKASRSFDWPEKAQRQMGCPHIAGKSISTTIGAGMGFMHQESIAIQVRSDLRLRQLTWGKVFCIENFNLYCEQMSPVV